MRGSVRRTPAGAQVRARRADFEVEEDGLGALVSGFSKEVVMRTKLSA